MGREVSGSHSSKVPAKRHNSLSKIGGGGRFKGLNDRAQAGPEAARDDVSFSGVLHPTSLGHAAVKSNFVIEEVENSGAVAVIWLHDPSAGCVVSE